MKFCPTCKSKFPTDINYCPNDATKLIVDSESGPSSSLIGMILDNRYRIISKLGEGGMGSVYAAEHILLRKNVAIKVLRYDLARREEVVKRFQNEAIAASLIGHENIIEVTDFGRTPDGSVYFVMEYLNGLALADVIRSSGYITLRRAIPILLQITKALSVAHSRGIIHRDLKPENIVLIDKPDRKDFVKILDFGISKMLDTSDRAEKLTAMGMIVGTPEYMSPEQAAGLPVDKRTDIYSLGVIMYEMMTGRLPFLADNAMRILMMHQTEKPVSPREINPEIHVGMEQIILKCMEKRPEDRFQDMSEITQSLIRLLSVTSMTQEPKKTMAFSPQAISPVGQVESYSTQPPTSSTSSVRPATSVHRTSSSGNTGLSSGITNSSLPQTKVSGLSQPSQIEESMSEDVQNVNLQLESAQIASGDSVLQSQGLSLDSVVRPSEKPIEGYFKGQTAAPSVNTQEGLEIREISGEVDISSSTGVNWKRYLAYIGLGLLIILGGIVLYYILAVDKFNVRANVSKPEETKQEQVVALDMKVEEMKENNRQAELVNREDRVEEREEEESFKKREIKTARIADSVVILITSEPENVEIYRGSIMVGVTPFQLKGKKNSSIEYVFRKLGYEPLRKKIVFSSSGEMKVNLKKIEDQNKGPKKEKDLFEKIDDLKDLSF
ncbi:MAG: serine/threonine protein kinase [Deltaproteobacteria bacterium]|nr:serine/threonine protein kinase [Deltaproteobacteria bacterium]